MEYTERSEKLIGYRVKIRRRDAFRVTGYSIVVPPGRSTAIPDFWNDVASDGRLDRLTKASSVRPWVLGLGSWDPECQRGGQRYTICIEETDYTDFSRLATECPLFTKGIGASD